VSPRTFDSGDGEHGNNDDDSFHWSGEHAQKERPCANNQQVSNRYLVDD
jgi:hypothetical protein